MKCDKCGKKPVVKVRDAIEGEILKFLNFEAHAGEVVNLCKECK